MSKRPRDNTLIESLKAILNASTEICESLLDRTNNNIEEAIDLYFSNPPSITTQTKKKKPNRYYLGDLVISGRNDNNVESIFLILL